MAKKTPKRVPATDFRQRLTELLREAAAGEVIQVTMRGIPVAEIGPVSK